MVSHTRNMAQKKPSTRSGKIYNNHNNKKKKVFKKIKENVEKIKINSISNSSKVSGGCSEVSTCDKKSKKKRKNIRNSSSSTMIIQEPVRFEEFNNKKKMKNNDEEDPIIIEDDDVNVVKEEDIIIKCDENFLEMTGNLPHNVLKYLNDITTDDNINHLEEDLLVTRLRMKKNAIIPGDNFETIHFKDFSNPFLPILGFDYKDSSHHYSKILSNDSDFDLKYHHVIHGPNFNEKYIAREFVFMGGNIKIYENELMKILSMIKFSEPTNMNNRFVNLIAFDFETSGVDHITNGVLEFACQPVKTKMSDFQTIKQVLKEIQDLYPILANSTGNMISGLTEKERKSIDVNQDYWNTFISPMIGSFEYSKIHDSDMYTRICHFNDKVKDVLAKYHFPKIIFHRSIYNLMERFGMIVGKKDPSFQTFFATRDSINPNQRAKQIHKISKYYDETSGKIVIEKAGKVISNPIVENHSDFYENLIIWLDSICPQVDDGVGMVAHNCAFDRMFFLKYLVSPIICSEKLKRKIINRVKSFYDSYICMLSLTNITQTLFSLIHLYKKYCSDSNDNNNNITAHCALDDTFMLKKLTLYILENHYSPFIDTKIMMTESLKEWSLYINGVGNIENHVKISAFGEREVYRDNHIVFFDKCYNKNGNYYHQKFNQSKMSVRGCEFLRVEN